MDSAASTLSIEQIIYQATKDIFVGEKAKVRKIKPVKKSIQGSAGKGSLVRHIITQHGADTVHQTVLKLLSDKVYQSSQIASSRFPGLFEPSVAQNETRVQLEAEAAKTEEAAIQGIVQTQWTNDEGALNWRETTTTLHGRPHLQLGFLKII